MFLPFVDPVYSNNDFTSISPHCNVLLTSLVSALSITPVDIVVCTKILYSLFVIVKPCFSQDNDI